MLLRFLVISLLGCAAIASAEDSQILRKNLIGKTPPELKADKAHWLGNSAPVTLADLKGRVVWLQFNF